MPLRGFTTAFVLGVLSGQAWAIEPVAYAEAFDTLYSVDLAGHQASEIGRATPLESQFRFANIVGLTFSPDGVLYGVSDAGPTKTLLTIDRGTGLATVVGTLDLGTDQQLDLGLAFTCDGQLWMSAGTGDFWSVDPQHATATHLGNFGVTVTGLAARGSKLYATGSQGNNNLYEIDRVHASASLIGSYGFSNYITIMSPGFDVSGKLWAVLDYVPPPSGPSPDWSDLTQLHIGSGRMGNVDAITPSQPKWAGDLQQIGLKGLAVPAAVCAAGTVSSTPALSWSALACLAVLLAFVSGTVLRRRRQNG